MEILTLIIAESIDFMGKNFGKVQELEVPCVTEFRESDCPRNQVFVWKTIKMYIVFSSSTYKNHCFRVTVEEQILNISVKLNHRDERVNCYTWKAS